MQKHTKIAAIVVLALIVAVAVYMNVGWKVKKSSDSDGNYPCDGSLDSWGCSYKDVTPEDCKAKCKGSDKCKGFSYSISEKKCWLKEKINKKKTNNANVDLYVK